MLRCTSSRSSFHSKCAGFDLAADLRHAALDGGDGLRALMMPWRGQHLGVRQAAGDVGLPQALVEEHAGGVALDQVAHGLGEQRGPRLGLFIELVLWTWEALFQVIGVKIRWT